MAKLAVSNIAWSGDHADHGILEALVGLGVEGIEAAPNRLWPGMEGASVVAAGAIRQRYASFGLQIPAMQALLFGAKGVAIFGTEEEEDRLVAAITRVAALGAALGARALVFGSPGLRNPPQLESPAVRERALSVFYRLAAAVQSEGTTLALEANPSQYGCAFLTTLAEAAAFVRELGHPGLRAHVDVGQLALSEPDPAATLQAALPEAIHFHASQPALARFNPIDPVHAVAAGSFAAVVRAPEWISVEMREDPNDPLGALVEAVGAVRTVYAAVLPQAGLPR